jgi:hypothetical protein
LGPQLGDRRLGVEPVSRDAVVALSGEWGAVGPVATHVPKKSYVIGISQSSLRVAVP